MPPCRVLTIVHKTVVAVQCFSVETKATERRKSGGDGGRGGVGPRQTFLLAHKRVIEKRKYVFALFDPVNEIYLL